MRPQVISSIPYSDIWGGEPSRAELEALIAKMDWRDVVTTIAGIAAIGWQQGIEDVDHIAVVESFVRDQPLYGASLISKLRADQSQVLFTDESLLAVLRLAIVSQGSSSRMQRELRDQITRAVLMANQLIHHEINPAQRTGSPADLMASEIRSKTSILENPHVLLARTAAFFDWCKNRGRSRSPNELPVESDFRELTGLKPREYAAGAYAALSRSAVIRQPINISRSAIFFTLDQWLSQIKQRAVPRQWIEVSSLPIEEARRDWKSEPSLSFAAAGKLWRRPIVRDGDQFFVPSPRLVWNALGDGTYFTLFDGYNDANRDKFSRFYSEFFEDYIRGLFDEAYAKRKDAATVRPFKYVRGRQKVDSSDVIITENNDVIFVEIVAKRLNLIGSVLRLDLESIEADVRRGILCKAKQLHDNIADYKAGVLLPNNPRPNGQRLFPVIVSPKDWPRIQIIHTFWPAEQRKQNLLLDAEPLEILDAGEVEILQPSLGSGVRFADLLDRKNRPPPGHHSSRNQSMHDYLVLTEPGILLKDNATRQRGEQIGTDLMEMVRSWSK
jgi:hypothetical protein